MRARPCKLPALSYWGVVIEGIPFKPSASSTATAGLRRNLPIRYLSLFITLVASSKDIINSWLSEAGCP